MSPKHRKGFQNTWTMPPLFTNNSPPQWAKKPGKRSVSTPLHRDHLFTATDHVRVVIGWNHLGPEGSVVTTLGPALRLRTWFVPYSPKRMIPISMTNQWVLLHAMFFNFVLSSILIYHIPGPSNRSPPATFKSTKASRGDLLEGAGIYIHISLSVSFGRLRLRGPARAGAPDHRQWVVCCRSLEEGVRANWAVRSLFKKRSNKQLTILQ